MAQGVVSPSMVSPALSNLKVKAAEHKPAQEQLKCSDLEFLLIPPTPALSLCFVLALSPAFFLAPVIQVLEQHNSDNRFCSLKTLKRPWSVGSILALLKVRKSWAHTGQQEGKGKPGRKGARRAVGKQWGTRRAQLSVEMHPQGRVCNENCFWRERICLLGLPVPGQLLSQLLLAFVWQIKLIWFFSLTRKVSL